MREKLLNGQYEHMIFFLNVCLFENLFLYLYKIKVLPIKSGFILAVYRKHGSQSTAAHFQFASQKTISNYPQDRKK